MPKPGDGYTRSDAFDFRTVRVLGDTAYAIYFLRSAVTEKKEAARNLEWLESAVLRRSGSGWKVASSTRHARQARRRRPSEVERARPARAGWNLAGAATLFVLWHNERFLINPRAPDWAHFDPIRWQLVPHGIGGALALLLGALQFSTRIRARFPHVHRLFGGLYMGGTFVAGPVAIWMAFINSPWFLVPFTIVQAATWMLFTGIAYRCIRRGDATQHRQWMTRSYGIVLIFLEGRVLMAIPALARHGMDAIVLVNWACLSVTLVVTECLLNWEAVTRPSVLSATRVRWPPG